VRIYVVIWFGRLTANVCFMEDQTLLFPIMDILNKGMKVIVRRVYNTNYLNI